MSTHTPGPWDAFPTALYDSGWLIEDGLGYRVAIVPNMSERPVNLCNACLIAAAPEMYEALQTLLRSADEVDPMAAGMLAGCALEMAKDAIAKATQP